MKRTSPPSRVRSWLQDCLSRIWFRPPGCRRPHSVAPTSAAEVAKNAGHEVPAPSTPGRMDALQEQPDAPSFAVLEPIADGFRNYQKTRYDVSAAELVVDRAAKQTVGAPEA